MKRKLNKWLSGILAACVLFTTVPVYAINDVSGTETSTEVVETSEETQSSEIETSSAEETVQESSESTKSSEITSEQTSETADEMLNISPMNLGDEEEPSTDNWELSTVFYDSTVDNGKTPLTSIDWDASDGSYKKGTPRVITVQINYKNTNAVTTYQPGDVEITIDGLLKDMNHTDYNCPEYFNISWNISANDETHTGYDWNVDADYLKYRYNLSGITTTYINDINTLTFTNAIAFEEKSNFEGSIQIEYTLTPIEENNSTNLGDNKVSSKTHCMNIERYDDLCTHTYKKELEAILTKTDNEQSSSIKSNNISFNYNRVYDHPWEKTPYTITKTANKISSYDGLPENATDFTWVKYTFSIEGTSSFYEYPNIGAQKFEIHDDFPTDVIVLDGSTYEVLKPDKNTYIIPWTYSYSKAAPYIFVGYPKSQYNEEKENLIVKNYAQLYALYLSDEEYSYCDDSECILNLGDFEFSYTGELYGITKRFHYESTSTPLYYQRLTTGYEIGRSSTRSEISLTAMYTGIQMDVKFGDDLVYITAADGTYRKLKDEEYYFSCADFPTLIDGNGNKITNKYISELWVRHANSTEYELYKASTNLGKTTFTSKDIVSYYFIIKDVNTSIIVNHTSNNVTNGGNNLVIENASGISETGDIFNFAFLEIYQNGTLVNEPSLDNYDTILSQMEIAKYDQETYSHYLQRSYSKCSYSKYSRVNLTPNFHVSKTMSEFIQNETNQSFDGTATLSAKYGNEPTRTYDTLQSYLDYYDSDTFAYDEGYTGCDIYDLLPEGMNLTSSAEDIKNNIVLSKNDYIDEKLYYNQNREVLTKNQLSELIKQNVSVEVIENWNNTNRTWIHINLDLSKYPIYFLGFGRDVVYNPSLFETKYTYSISYDTYIDYDYQKSWSNTAYSLYYGNALDFYSSSTPDILDINNNGKTEKMAYSTVTKNISSIIASHQDVQTQVQTTNDNFTVGKGTSPYGDKYTYKLRARTGQNAATNMVIANNLEMAFNNKKHWQGEFLGVDTSYIENKTFYVYDPSNPNADDEGNVAEKVKVKVYYSENPEETNLYLTEMTQVIEDGNEVSKEVFITDGDGNILKNTNWKEYTDDVDKSSVKSLAFELLNAETGEPAVIPANSLVYVLVTMKAPEDPYLNEDVNEEDRPLANDIKTFAYNNCWTQWTAIDSFGQEVDFVTGINSNIVKVALPYSVDTDELPTVTLKFTKEISGTDSDFENMLLDKAEERNFKITLTSLTANEDGSYNQITGLLSSTQGLTLSKVPIGTYLITESDDIYFDFVEMIPNNDEELIIDGVTLEKTDKGYVLTISDDLSGDVEFNIKVTNKIEPNRSYEDKEEKENLFKIPSLDA